jgi:pimeloyl-ACP methyl ester carboxylesterase
MSTANGSAEPTVRTVSTALGNVDCAEVGQGLPVLVVHGSPGGHDSGLAMARFLIAAGFRAIVPDRPGYFDTPLGSGETPDQQADLLAALLDALGIDRAGVLCWSGGGPAAYRLAVRHPSRVTALVGCAAVSRRYVFEADKGADKLITDTGLGRRMLQLMARHMPAKLVSATIASEGDLTSDQVKERVEQIMADPEKERFTLDLALAANHSGPRKAGFDNDMRQFALIESLELDRVGVPCLIVQGTADSDVDPEYSGFAARQIPGADLVELATGTHLAFWVHPDSAPVRQRAVELFHRAADRASAAPEG